LVLEKEGKQENWLCREGCWSRRKEILKIILNLRREKNRNLINNYKTYPNNPFLFLTIARNQLLKSLNESVRSQQKFTIYNKVNYMRALSKKNQYFLKSIQITTPI
jgi:hypothetical protein